MQQILDAPKRYQDGIQRKKKRSPTVEHRGGNMLCRINQRNRNMPRDGMGPKRRCNLQTPRSMSTKPCLFDRPMSNAERQKRWRQAHPEHKPIHTAYVRNWRARLNASTKEESKEK